VNHDSSTPRPPRFASWLLRRVLPRDGRGASIAGDLLEEFHADAAARSRAAAVRRYWRHALSIGARYAFTRRRGATPLSPIASSRRSPVPSGLREDLRDAFRSLIKHPGFAMVAILTLAVGAGANTAIFSVLHAVVLRDLPYRDADRLAPPDRRHNHRLRHTSPPRRPNRSHDRATRRLAKRNARTSRALVTIAIDQMSGGSFGKPQVWPVRQWVARLQRGSSDARGDQVLIPRQTPCPDPRRGHERLIAASGHFDQNALVLA
jgi:hypothetical protein